jgi:hypothetical protein
MQRDTSIESIDPAEVESIEIMENPPVKYLKDGHATVLNIKLKKRSQTYRLLNLYNDVHPGMVTNSLSIPSCFGREPTVKKGMNTENSITPEQTKTTA